jgi:hypothetical protein
VQGDAGHPGQQGGGQEKNNREKWRAEEEMHKKVCCHLLVWNKWPGWRNNRFKRQNFRGLCGKLERYYKAEENAFVFETMLTYFFPGNIIKPSEASTCPQVSFGLPEADADQVPLVPKVLNIGLQMFVIKNTLNLYVLHFCCF